jgi:small membrane protein
MIVQILLTLGLVGLGAYAFTQRGRSRVVAWSMILVCLVGEVLVLFPDLANRIAQFVGVGRGADLILYAFIVVTLGLILNLHLRLHAMHQDMTQLARRMAHLTATKPGDPPPPS